MDGVRGLDVFGGLVLEQQVALPGGNGLQAFLFELALALRFGLAFGLFGRLAGQHLALPVRYGGARAVLIRNL